MIASSPVSRVAGRVACRISSAGRAMSSIARTQRQPGDQVGIDRHRSVADEEPALLDRPDLAVGDHPTQDQDQIGLAATAAPARCRVCASPAGQDHAAPGPASRRDTGGRTTRWGSARPAGSGRRRAPGAAAAPARSTAAGSAVPCGRSPRRARAAPTVASRGVRPRGVRPRCARLRSSRRWRSARRRAYGAGQARH